MKNIHYIFSAFMCFGPPVSAHMLKCEDFKTYQQAVEHCKQSLVHSWPDDCGNHDRDDDGRPCECLKGGPETDPNACGDKTKKED
jgi:hypothetical protein